MSFFEDIASALDQHGIEARISEAGMLVPITTDLEIHFIEINPYFPAANVYIAAAGVGLDGYGSGYEEDESSLVSVVFSVEDAVQAVIGHIATDQMIQVLGDLLHGYDERLSDLMFLQDTRLGHVVTASVANNSTLVVIMHAGEDVPAATLKFVAGQDDEELPLDLLHPGRQPSLMGEYSEVLELGVFEDFDRLFDVIALAAQQADLWEALLEPFEDDLYDFDFEF